MTKNLLRRLEVFYDDIGDECPYRTKTVAFLIRQNKIIAFGVNSFKTDPKQRKWQRRCYYKEYDNYIYNRRHAEIDCIARTPHDTDFSKCEMVVLSKKKDNSFRLAKPCPACMAAIQNKKIKRIWFSTYDNDVIERSL